MNTEIITENSILSAPGLSPISKTTSIEFDSISSGSGSDISWSTLLRYGLIFLILAFLGLNIFTYLGKTTDFITATFRPLLAFFGYGIAETAKQTIDITAKGTKDIINVAAGTATGGINVLENTLASASGRASASASASTGARQSTNAALQNAQRNPQPDDRSKPNSKSGFCYIGEDRGFRSCIGVGEGDSCMSGDIFPTMDMCINPNLR